LGAHDRQLPLWEDRLTETKQYGPTDSPLGIMASDPIRDDPPMCRGALLRCRVSFSGRTPEPRDAGNTYPPQDFDEG